MKRDENQKVMMKHNSYISNKDHYSTEHQQNPGTYQINQTFLDSAQCGAQSAAAESC